MAGRKLPPAVNLDVDDESDAVSYIEQWTRGVQRQRERSTAACRSVDGVVEATFLVVAAFQLSRSVEMLLRHEAAVQQALVTFSRAQPNLRLIRNALEHHDEFLRGQGLTAKGMPWFPLGTSKYKGAHYLLLPPLGGNPADALNLDALADDVLDLAQEAVRAANSSLSRRFTRRDPLDDGLGPELEVSNDWKGPAAEGADA